MTESEDTVIDIDQTMIYMSALIEAGNVLDDMRGDLSTFEKIIALGRMWDEFLAIAEADFDEAKLEILNLNQREKAEIVRLSALKYDIDSNKMEEQIERALELSIRLFDVFVEAGALWNKVKA